MVRVEKFANAENVNYVLFVIWILTMDLFMVIDWLIESLGKLMFNLEEVSILR